MSLHASCVRLKNGPQRRRVGCDVLVVSFPLKSPEGTFLFEQRSICVAFPRPPATHS